MMNGSKVERKKLIKNTTRISISRDIVNSMLALRYHRHHHHLPTTMFHNGHHALTFSVACNPTLHFHIFLYYIERILERPTHRRLGSHGIQVTKVGTKVN